MPVVDPNEILAEIAPENVPLDSPPDVSNYREADVQGISCAFCQKFAFTGLRDGEIPVGVCDQWEANADGVHVCDRFASGLPVYSADGKEVWDVGFSGDERIVAQMHLSGGDMEKQGDKRFRKSILRTGEWVFTPGMAGLSRKKLQIVRDGQSDPAKGIISMQELVDNFNEKALQHVPLTLSEDDREHPDTKSKLTRYARGFVRSLDIKDFDDGSAQLFADIDVTEPEVAEKIERKTFVDVSSGIPFGVTRKSDGKVFGAVLEHVALTNNPFIDRLEPFGIAAADDDGPVAVETYEEVSEEEQETPPEVVVEEEEEQAPALSFAELLVAANNALVSQLGLSRDYLATDVRGEELVVTNTIASTTWTVPYSVSEGSVSLVTTDQWTVQEGEDAPASSGTPVQLSELDRVHQLRELRLSQHGNDTTGGNQMPIGIEALDGVELSDEARAAVQSVLSENADLRAKNRTSDADRRIEELKGIGFENRPGFLKLYRQVYLSDDGGPAAILLSDEGQTEQRLTAVEILDRAIDAMQGSEGKVEFSDQAISSGNDNKPPATAEGEIETPLEERVESAKAELGLKK